MATVPRWRHVPGQVQVVAGERGLRVQQRLREHVKLMHGPRQVSASWLALTFMSRSRNLSGSSRWGVCADLSNHTNCLLGAVSESWNRCAASPGAAGEHMVWMCGRMGAGGLRGVALGHAHTGAEALYLRQLGWVDVGTDVHVYADLPGPRGVGQSLAEVPARGTHDRAAARQRTQQEVGTHALEAAKWIGRFQLHEHGVPKRSAQLLVDELWAVSEGGVNDLRRLDPREVQVDVGHVSYPSRRVSAGKHRPQIDHLPMAESRIIPARNAMARDALRPASTYRVWAIVISDVTTRAAFAGAYCSSTPSPDLEGRRAQARPGRTDRNPRLGLAALNPTAAWARRKR